MPKTVYCALAGGTCIENYSGGTGYTCNSTAGYTGTNGQLDFNEFEAAGNAGQQEATNAGSPPMLVANPAQPP